MKITAVIVTYNRVELLRKSVAHLLAQSRKPDSILIVDNASSDETEAFCCELMKERKEIEYLRLLENTGGAGGFYTGIKVAIKRGADYIWGMDDDAFAQREALEKIVTLLDSNRVSCFWSNCDDDQEFQKEMKPVKEWMFVGFFIPKEIVKKVGLPRKDFFIYLDDFEYAYRIRKKGFKIYKVRDSKIIHTAGTQKMFPDKKILGIKFRWSELPDWKLYYRIRNYILVYPWNDWNKYVTITLKMAKMFFLTALFDSRQVKIFLRAYKDGIMGRSGKRMEP
ncbi:MAG: glycosyltransferase family 2 protein [Clostridium sp.]